MKSAYTNTCESTFPVTTPRPHLFDGTSVHGRHEEIFLYGGVGVGDFLFLGVVRRRCHGVCHQTAAFQRDVDLYESSRAQIQIRRIVKDQPLGSE